MLTVYINERTEETIFEQGDAGCVPRVGEIVVIKSWGYQDFGYRVCSVEHYVEEHMVKLFVEFQELK